MRAKNNQTSALLDIIIAAAAFGAAYYYGKSIDLAFTGPASTVTALIVISILLAVRGTNWGVLGLRSPKNIGSVIGAFVIAVLLIVAVAAFALTIMPLLEPYVGQQIDSGRFSNLVGDLQAYLFVMVFIVWVGAGFGEEMLFRGFFMTRIAEVTGGGKGAWVIALIVQATIFGALHYAQGLYGIVQSGMIGLIFGVAYLIFRRNLWPLIIAHGAVDSISITQIYLGSG